MLLPTKSSNLLSKALRELAGDLRASAEAKTPAERDSVEWIQNNFYIPERKFFPNPAIELAPYQRAVLREAYRRDSTGQFVYSVVVWSDIKKSAKSSIAAAVALERATRQDWASIKVVANDLKQADSRVSYYARRAIELNPDLKRQAKARYYSILLDNHSTIEAIPIDPTGEAGGNDDLIIFSELWGAKGTASQRMWSEMTLSPTKMGQSQRWVETYAGFTGESPLLEQLYEQGVVEGQQIGERLGIPDLEVYANPTARLLCLWNTQPRLDWQTPEYYAQEAAVLLPSEFERMHRNQWASPLEAFVPVEWWNACQKELPPIGKWESWVMAIDAGVSSDCFAVVCVAVKDGVVTQRYTRKWEPRKGETIDFSEPETEIRRLCKAHRIEQITYDPYQLHDMMTRLKRDGVAWIDPFGQQSERLKGDKLFYDLIREGRYQHDGNPDMTEHVMNANAKKDGDNKLRIVKRSETSKVDLAVAAAMASARARDLAI